MSERTLLRVDELSGGYGFGTVLRKVSIDVPAGSTCVLIGPNGAGKTTLLRGITAQLPKRNGRVSFDDEDVTGLPAHRLVARGIAHVPQGARLFPDLTVEQNLVVAAAGVRIDAAEFRKRVEEIRGVLPVVVERLHDRAGSLSGGQRQMVAIARGLLSHPQLLLMDEPTTGLAPRILDSLAEVVHTLQSRGQTVLIAEQNARFALMLADYAYLMKGGVVAAQGDAAEMMERPEVREVYLGVRA